MRASPLNPSLSSSTSSTCLLHTLGKRYFITCLTLHNRERHPSRFWDARLGSTWSRCSRRESRVDSVIVMPICPCLGPCLLTGRFADRAWLWTRTMLGKRAWTRRLRGMQLSKSTGVIRSRYVVAGRQASIFLYLVPPTSDTMLTNAFRSCTSSVLSKIYSSITTILPSPRRHFLRNGSCRCHQYQAAT